MNQEQTSAVRLLRHKLEEARLRNPNWSLRAFAQKLGMSSGALSEVLQGKRPLSLKARKKIIERLQLSPEEQRDLLADQIDPLLKREQKLYHQLDSDSFHLIADWWHFAILNLTRTKNFQPSLPWLVSRLGISKGALKEAWERLLRLGYLEKNAKGHFVRRHPRLKTTEDVMDLSIRKAHLEDLKLIEKTLLEVPVAKRECTSMTMPVKLADLGQAKELIRRFEEEFCEQVESDGADEVYRLTISFYPLTQSLTEKNE